MCQGKSKLYGGFLYQGALLYTFFLSTFFITNSKLYYFCESVKVRAQTETATLETTTYSYNDRVVWLNIAMRRYEQERWSPTATHRKRERQTDKTMLQLDSSLVNSDKRGVAATTASSIS